MFTQTAIAVMWMVVVHRIDLDGVCHSRSMVRQVERFHNDSTTSGDITYQYFSPCDRNIDSSNIWKSLFDA